ncbi:MAG: hypothetical protein WCD42_01540 [Rhizomicrobium sp.]
MTPDSRKSAADPVAANIGCGSVMPKNVHAARTNENRVSMMRTLFSGGRRLLIWPQSCEILSAAPDLKLKTQRDKSALYVYT